MIIISNNIIIMLIILLFLFFVSFLMSVIIYNNYIEKYSNNELVCSNNRRNITNKNQIYDYFYSNNDLYRKWRMTSLIRQANYLTLNNDKNMRRRIKYWKWRKKKCEPKIKQKQCKINYKNNNYYFGINNKNKCPK